MQHIDSLAIRQRPELANVYSPVWRHRLRADLDSRQRSRSNSLFIIDERAPWPPPPDIACVIIIVIIAIRNPSLLVPSYPLSILVLLAYIFLFALLALLYASPSHTLHPESVFNLPVTRRFSSFVSPHKTPVHLLHLDFPSAITLHIKSYIFPVCRTSSHSWYLKVF